MSDSNNDFTPDERVLAVRLFSGLYILSLAINVAVILAVAYAGFIGWAPGLVIPFGAVSMFFARVLKRYLSNIVAWLRVDKTLDDEDLAVHGVQRARLSRWMPKTVLLMMALMSAVSALWYVIGTGIRWAFG